MTTDVTPHTTPFSTMESSTDWWREATIYQIYPRSFADGDGDGIGDLTGITSRLGHLRELGADAVWLSPFYRSPQIDAGYDVSDYMSVDPLFGSLDDFDRLVEVAHGLDLRVIVDIVPNHSSSAHPWFVEALAAPPGSPERDRFVFRDGKGSTGDESPNNWRSAFRGPAWTRTTNADGTPGQWYLHLFDSAQPDFNWENPDVREMFDDVLRFWLRRGVDGFRVDVARALIKDPALPDFPVEYQHARGETPDGRRSPIFDQDGVHEVYRRWRRVLKEFGPDKILVAEAHVEPLERLARYIREDEMQQAFNFSFLSAPLTAHALTDVISSTISTTRHVGASPTWVLNNHDEVRLPTRLGLPSSVDWSGGIGPSDTQPDEELGLRRARAAALIMLALPGSVYIYQGEELGLPEHTTLSPQHRQDPTFERSDRTEVGRDGCRVPIPWEAANPAFGFSSTGQSWLPQPTSWQRYAVDQQRGVADSTLELYRAALRERRGRKLGRAEVALVDANPELLEFTVGSIRVIANTTSAAVPFTAAGEVLIASSPLADDGLIPAHTTVWFQDAT